MKKNKKILIAVAAVVIIMLAFCAVALAASESASSSSFIETFKAKFELNFIKDNRWKYLMKGLRNTLLISIFAVAIGIVVGFVIAIIRSSYDMSRHRNIFFTVLNGFLKLYLTVIRGTPALIQLLIMYYVIFISPGVSKLFVASVTFGLNSSAYLAEIVRSGIMSIDPGQFEAGRSLGFNHAQTMIHFILPQAFKNVLPALGNEFIVLIKETSISGYIGLEELTKGGDIIRSNTYEAFLPLIAVALIYLVIVVFLSTLVGMMERRLKKDAR